MGGAIAAAAARLSVRRALRLPDAWVVPARRARFQTIVALLALHTGAGCQRADSQYHGPYAEQVASAIPAIETASGLKFKRRPNVEARSKEQVRAFVEQKFNEDAPAKEMAATEAVYKRLGLIPDTVQLRRLMLDLLTEQIVGYYDPAKKTLYIVNGSPRDLVGVTVTHELVHALQDQYVNLDSLQHVQHDDDRQTAGQAVMEGQAVYEQLAVMLGPSNVAARLPGAWNQIRETIRAQQSGMPVFAGAPLVIQESLIFPYLSGAEFVRRYVERFPGRAPFDSLPTSTEQILHEQAYFGPRDVPTRVTFPAPTRGMAISDNNLGEFGTRLFLYQHLQDQAAAFRGAAGWDGDRYVLVEVSGGQALVWLTIWDTTVDGGEFADLLNRAVVARYPSMTPGPAAPNVTSYAGEGRAVRIATVEVQGRPAVVFVDAPAGTSLDLFDLSKVQLAQ